MYKEPCAYFLSYHVYVQHVQSMPQVAAYARNATPFQTTNVDKNQLTFHPSTYFPVIKPFVTVRKVLSLLSANVTQIRAAGITTPPSDKPGVYTRQSGIPIVKYKPRCSLTIPHDLGCVPKR